MTWTPAEDGPPDAGPADGRAGTGADGRADGSTGTSGPDDPVRDGTGAGPEDPFPGADDVTATAVVTELDRPVAGLSRWIAGAHAVAAGSGRTLYLVTGESTRITYPLELLLAASPAARWVVRSASGRCRDGLSGQPVRWDGQRFAADGTAANGSSRTGSKGTGGTATGSGGTGSSGTGSDGSRSGARRADDGGYDAERAAPRLDGPGSVRLDITRLEPAAGTADIAATASAAAIALTGAVPTGWGAGEPVTEPWSPRDVTAFARDRAPRPASVVITAGSGARSTAGVLEAEPAASGVHTRVRLAVGAQRYPGPEFLASLDDLAAALAAEGAHAMLVGWQPGRADATREARTPPPGMPVALFAGHQIVAARGVEHARAAPAESTAIVGSGAQTGCWCRFGTERPHQALVDVMNHFRQW